MNAPKLSKSPVLNAVYVDIWEYLDGLGLDEIKHYMGGFPNEPDYNLVNYGCMRVYYSDIREMYTRAGAKAYAETYKRARGENLPGEYKISDSQMWEAYRRDVGRVAREYVKRAKAARPSISVRAPRFSQGGAGYVTADSIEIKVDGRPVPAHKNMELFRAVAALINGGGADGESLHGLVDGVTLEF